MGVVPVRERHRVLFGNPHCKIIVPRLRSLEWVLILWINLWSMGKRMTEEEGEKEKGERKIDVGVI